MVIPLISGHVTISIKVSDRTVKKLIDSQFDILPRAGWKGGYNGADGFLHGVINILGLIIEKPHNY